MFSGAALISGAAIVFIIIVTKGDLQLRKKMPEANCTFKVPLYPVTPIFGVISCFLLLFYLKTNALIAAGVLTGFGFIAYEYNERRKANPF